MKNLLITKIALALSAVAVVFSIITLVRSISENKLVFAAVLQLTGSVLIVGVCLINIYLTRHNDGDSSEQDDEETSSADENADDNNEEASEEAVDEATEESADENKAEETENCDEVISQDNESTESSGSAE